MCGHKEAITHASGHEAEAEAATRAGRVKSFQRARVAGGGGAGAAAQNTHLQQVVVVLQHAVSLARVSEDPSGVLIVVKRGAWGSGGELLKDRRARHRLGGCLPVGGALSTDRRLSVAYSPSVSP